MLSSPQCTRATPTEGSAPQEAALPGWRGASPQGWLHTKAGLQTIPELSPPTATRGESAGGFQARSLLLPHPAAPHVGSGKVCTWRAREAEPERPREKPAAGVSLPRPTDPARGAGRTPRPGVRGHLTRVFPASPSGPGSQWPAAPRGSWGAQSKKPHGRPRAGVSPGDAPRGERLPGHSAAGIPLLPGRPGPRTAGAEGHPAAASTCCDPRLGEKREPLPRQRPGGG